jgi:hypothetical protein
MPNQAELLNPHLDAGRAGWLPGKSEDKPNAGLRRDWGR